MAFTSNGKTTTRLQLGGLSDRGEAAEIPSQNVPSAPKWTAPKIALGGQNGHGPKLGLVVHLGHFEGWKPPKRQILTTQPPDLLATL